MKRFVLSVLVLGVCLFSGSGAFAQDKAAAPATKPGRAQARARGLQRADIKWGDAPPVLAPGAKMAVLQGDPSKAGVYTVRLKAGDGYKIAPHWHPTTENVTVISGTFNVGTGDKADAANTTALTAGAFASMPAKMHHYAWFKGDTEVQVHGVGPFKLVYVNPADDPSKAPAKK